MNKIDRAISVEDKEALRAGVKSSCARFSVFVDKFSEIIFSK